MAKKDFDLEFDYEDEFDFEPRANLDSDDTDDFDLSEFGIDDLDIDMGQDDAADEDYSDFDIDALDLGEEPAAEEEDFLDLSGFDLGDDPDPDAPDGGAAPAPGDDPDDDFGLDEDLDLDGDLGLDENLGLDDDLDLDGDPDDGLDLDEDLDFGDEPDDEDEDLTAGIDFSRRADFFRTPVEEEPPVFEEEPPVREPEAEEPVDTDVPEEEPEDRDNGSRRRNRQRRVKHDPEEKAPRGPIKLTVPPFLKKLVKLYFPSAEEINMAADPAPDVNGRRRRRPSKRQIFKDYYLPTIIAGLALVLVFSFVIGSLSNAIDRKREKDKLEQMQAQQESEQAALQESEAKSLLAQAEELAMGYNYDEAITLLSSYSGEPTQEMTAKKAEYIETKSHLVEHKDPSIIPNLSFHCLIHDMARAMQDTDDLKGSYNRNFVSTSEFTKILDQLYKNGYVLVDFDSIVTNNNGTYFPNTIYLPEGKKPVMLTETMVNYFEYMIDSNKDGVLNDGDGFASRLVVDANGDIKAEMVDASGVTQVGDFDLVPILESFIKAHPDFSYQGARATLAVTGDEGIFGYRINTSVISTKGTEYYDQQVAGATKIVEALKEKGYNIACYTFANENYFGMSAAQVKADLQLWNAQIAPIVGQLDTIVFARASDLGDYTGGKFDVVFDNGFRILVKNADEPYAEVNSTYVRQSRLMVTGNSLAWKATQFAALFDANVVLDLATRGGSVPN